MRLLLERLPKSLVAERETLVRCLEAMYAALPFRRVLLFGSHARGEARADSDVDLCIVADGADSQRDAARIWRRAMRPVRPKPAFTLIPISPDRLAEKRRAGDHFFQTVLNEGVPLAAQD